MASHTSTPSPCEGRGGGRRGGRGTPKQHPPHEGGWPAPHEGAIEPSLPHEGGHGLNDSTRVINEEQDEDAEASDDDSEGTLEDEIALRGAERDLAFCRSAHERHLAYSTAAAAAALHAADQHDEELDAIMRRGGEDMERTASSVTGTS